MDIFVARQPIFNKNYKVIGYEILYRNSSVNNFNENLSPEEATIKVLNNVFIQMGIDLITRGKKAFINFPEENIKNRLPELFSKDVIVVEILENVEPDFNFIESIKLLKNKGYRIALDDFELINYKRYFGLLELVDIIKVDFLKNDKKTLSLIPRIFSGKNVTILAEKIETLDDFKFAINNGYELFQGYFFQKPEIISGKSIPVIKKNYFEIIKELNKDEVNFDKIEEIIEKDVSLSYELLRLVNSSIYYKRNDIYSIKQALVFLGYEELRKWMGIMLIKDLVKDKPDELTLTSLARARFCESIAKEIGEKEDSILAYFVGLFSMIDVILNRPMEEILDNLMLPERVKEALVEKKSKLWEMLNLVISYEKGDWERVEKYSKIMNIETNLLAKIHFSVWGWLNLLSI